MKIYVAPSWRNQHQQAVVASLRAAGHEVYDFKNPVPGDNGFHWSEIDPNWKDWWPEEYIKNLEHPLAVDGFNKDFNAMKWCDACVLVNPCGRSAHLELGWCAGAGKKTVILVEEVPEPELMVKMADYIAPSLYDVIEWLKKQEEVKEPADA